ncbi:hypothetical protein K438DRAFT_1910721 [Mycena galopus ATCC 62051]|nr:hypothetical protein K438DRAFT_1910721 [Mycena galopus ATCC 62051]
MHSTLLSFVVLSVLNTAIALPSSVAMRGGKTDPTLGDTDLLNSCPGAVGSPNVERADKCTLINIVNNPQVVNFQNVGSPFLNCDGETDALTVMLGGSTTADTSTTVNADLGIDIDGITLGGGASTTTDNSQTVSQSQTFDVPPGRQAILTAGFTFKSQTGNVQVNYGDQVNGHFIWFTGATVTQQTLTNAAVEYQVHETACGTDPTDLNNQS